MCHVFVDAKLPSSSITILNPAQLHTDLFGSAMRKICGGRAGDIGGEENRGSNLAQPFCAAIALHCSFIFGLMIQSSDCVGRSFSGLCLPWARNRISAHHHIVKVDVVVVTGGFRMGIESKVGGLSSVSTQVDVTHQSPIGGYVIQRIGRIVVVPLTQYGPMRHSIR